MLGFTDLRPRSSILIAVALLVALLCAAPALLQPAPASAQGVICGGIHYPSACGDTGSTSPGVTCGGIYYANLTSCPSGVSYQACPDGSLVPIGQGCPPPVYTRPDGSVIVSRQTCPATTGMISCSVPSAACATGFRPAPPAGWNPGVLAPDA